jgi:cobalt-zinc-cadmium efflux system outer membrane protein
MISTEPAQHAIKRSPRSGWRMSVFLVLLGWRATPVAAQADAPTASGQPERADAHFSLADSLRIMRASHPQLLAQRDEVRARDADVVDTKLWSNPRFDTIYAKGVRHSSYDDFGYLFYGVTQFIEVSNAPGMRKRQSTFLASAERAEQDSLVNELSLDLESALIDLVAAQRTQALLDNTLLLLESAGRIVNERVQAGAAPRYDASRIAVTLAIAHADRAEGSANLARAWAEFRAAVGPRAAELRGEPDYDLDSGPELPEVERLLAFLDRSRPDLVAARARAASAEAAVRVSRRNVFPGVNVTLAGGYGAGPRQVDVGFNLSVPLPVIDHGQGAIPAAQARADEAHAEVDALRVPAMLRIQGMQQEVSQLKRALAEYRARGVASGEEMLNEAQAGYLAGRFSVLELADAYRAWREARLREIALGASARQAEVDLGRELGRPLHEL